MLISRDLTDIIPISICADRPFQIHSLIIAVLNYSDLHLQTKFVSMYRCHICRVYINVPFTCSKY